MSLKENLLELLQKNSGEFLSGEKAAEILSVSRTAVWKAVTALKNSGKFVPWQVVTISTDGRILDR